jgi:hypothetical protein
MSAARVPATSGTRGFTSLDGVPDLPSHEAHAPAG